MGIVMMTLVDIYTYMNTLKQKCCRSDEIFITVVLTTSGAPNDKNLVEMSAFAFRCIHQNLVKSQNKLFSDEPAGISGSLFLLCQQGRLMAVSCTHWWLCVCYVSPGWWADYLCMNRVCLDWAGAVKCLQELMLNNLQTCSCAKLCLPNCSLTHWDRDKMAAFLQTTL